MKEFFGVIKYEYKMSIKRKGLLIISLLFIGFYIYSMTSSYEPIKPENMNTRSYLMTAGNSAFFVNLFFPVFVGISAADRAIRDNKIGVKEIFRSTRISNQMHLFGKYIGVTLSYVTIELIIGSVVGILFVLVFHYPLVLILYSIIAILVIAVPALFFVIGFSLVCPYFMPLRIYQILFTGYWYWGNYINPDFIPSISRTILNASGMYPMYRYFDTESILASNNPPNAILNIIVIVGLGVLAIFAMSQYQNRVDQKA